MKVELTNYINSINLNIQKDFPYLVLDVVKDKAYPKNAGFQVMHWHEDLQLIYVIKGTIEVITLDTRVQIKEYEGIFINKNVIHRIQQIEDCHYKSFIFPTYFLQFYPRNPTHLLVDSIVENKQFTYCHFTLKENWCHEVLEILNKLSVLENNKTDWYVYEVLVSLCRIWLNMNKHLHIPQEKQNDTSHIRLQKILLYIEEHYSEDISLSDLAGSVNISESECFRCFKAILKTSPYKYLKEFRLLKATQLLKNTDVPIGNIAQMVGFHQMSHFGKCFKERIGCSPREFRTKNSYNI